MLTTTWIVPPPSGIGPAAAVLASPMWTTETVSAVALEIVLLACAFGVLARITRRARPHALPGTPPDHRRPEPAPPGEVTRRAA